MFDLSAVAWQHSCFPRTLSRSHFGDMPLLCNFFNAPSFQSSSMLAIYQPNIHPPSCTSLLPLLPSLPFWHWRALHAQMNVASKPIAAPIHCLPCNANLAASLLPQLIVKLTFYPITAVPLGIFQSRTPTEMAACAAAALPLIPQLAHDPSRPHEAPLPRERPRPRPPV